MKKLLVLTFFIAGCAYASAPDEKPAADAMNPLNAGIASQKTKDKVGQDLLILNAISKDADYARVTFYDPDVNNAMEGGPCTNRGNIVKKKGKALGCTGGEYLNSVEDSIQNKRPVSVAADDKGAFGASCNSVRGDKRCTILIYLQGFDRLYPNYHKSFPHLPKDTFIALVEDTGGDFHYTKGHRFDIAVRSRQLARAAPGFIRSEVHWTKLQSPCGLGAKSRTCEFADAHLAPTVLAMLNLKEDQ